MNIEELKQIWLKEQEAAHIHGWDFFHISGRYEEENDLPWDYKQIVLSYMKDDMKVLDIDTGGGEFLLSLRHPTIRVPRKGIRPMCRYANKYFFRSELISRK